MEMTVKIVLKSGKELVLTKEEYNELKEGFKEEVEVQKYFPYEPYTYPYPLIWYGDKYATGGYTLPDGYTITTASTTVGDITTSDTKWEPVEECMKRRYDCSPVTNSTGNNWD